MQIFHISYFTFHFFIVPLHPLRGPDGGIGRRAGLKHQWGNPCRFDPGSGTTMRWSQQKARCCKTTTYSTFLFLHKHEIFPTFSPPMQI